MTIPITQPEKKIPANEDEFTLDGGFLVPETNTFGQNFRSGIDPPVATFAGAALPVVKMPSEGSENSIEVSSCCGCPNPCKCNPCHCEGFAIDPNTVTLVASVAPPVLMMISGVDPTVAIFASAALPVKRPSEGSENSIEVSSCCGCPNPCKCDPCHCEGPSEGSKKSIEGDHGSCSQPRDMKK